MVGIQFKKQTSCTSFLNQSFCASSLKGISEQVSLDTCPFHFSISLTYSCSLLSIFTQPYMPLNPRFIWYGSREYDQASLTNQNVCINNFVYGGYRYFKFFKSKKVSVICHIARKKVSVKHKEGIIRFEEGLCVSARRYHRFSQIQSS